MPFRVTHKQFPYFRWTITAAGAVPPCYHASVLVHLALAILVISLVLGERLHGER